MRNILVSTVLGLLLLAAQAVQADEWEGLKPEDLGISMDEFRMVREKGMSRNTLMHLLEVGVSPNEYFSEPWKKLGVTEDHWLSEKKAGMEDDDINKAFRKGQSNSLDPIVAFILPGYYHYRTKKPYVGLGFSTVAAAGLALTFLHKDESVKGEPTVRMIYPIMVLVSMIGSAGYALVQTRFIDNQEAQRFSYQVDLLPEGGIASRLAMRF